MMVLGSVSGSSLPIQGQRAGTCGQAHIWARPWALGLSEEQDLGLTQGLVRT